MAQTSKTPRQIIRRMDTAAANPLETSFRTQNVQFNIIYYGCTRKSILLKRFYDDFRAYLYTNRRPGACRDNI